jgi:hypothetical protein
MSTTESILFRLPQRAAGPSELRRTDPRTRLGRPPPSAPEILPTSRATRVAEGSCSAAAAGLARHLGWR